MKYILGNKSFPVSAWLLGISGAIPFIFFSTLLVTKIDFYLFDASFALRAYGAVILSFLGGVQWGLVIQDFRHRVNSQIEFGKNLVLSIIPAVIGWTGMLTDQVLGMCILGVGFALVFLVDLRIARIGYAPDWYLRLRIPLTILVILTLLSALLYGM